MKIDMKNAVLTIRDGTAVTPKETIVKIGEGNFTWSEKRNIEYVLNRGLLDTTREGDQVPVDIRFDFVWEHLKSHSAATVATPYEALKKIGEASDWVSSAADVCEPYAVDLELEHTPPCAGVGNVPEVIVFSDFRWESLDQDLRAGTVSASGKANITAPTITRTEA